MEEMKDKKGKGKKLVDFGYALKDVDCKRKWDGYSLMKKGDSNNKK